MKIDELRKDIDRIDDTIIELLATRNAVSREIGRLKKKEGKDITDKQREIEIIKRLKEKAKEQDLDDMFIDEIYRIIMSKSKEEQR
ncbi:chorismate mutase [Candidatus Woesearchaeota archaeon]|nr:chorismate mutase [Candidatus Woesearchaeota archaeon]